MTSTGAGRVECRELDQLGGMLRCFRERRLWTQELLAEHSNVSLNTISEAERGNRTKMHLTTVTMLADALGLAEEDRAAFRAVARGARRASAPLLPLPATSFLGRERAIAEVSALLARPDLRLLTLTGPGGIGKTRLALRVAEAMAPVFADGAHFVDLASVATADLVPGAMARAVGFVAHGGQPMDEALLDHLAERQLLLVLDNFEHVLDAADYVNRVLIDCPRVMLLVTSRERLGLSREQLYAVGTMSLPDADESPDAGTAAGSEAVRLFVERAATVQYGFALTAENLEDVIAICRELDGLPLAIELAAAQMAHVRSAASLRGRLDYRLPWLKGGSRDQTARHRTMRDAIAWSYEALTPADQAMFRRVAVFAGGFTADSAESVLRFEQAPAVFASIDTEQVLDRLTALVSKNLVQLYDSADGGTRYRLLETLREFGCEQLDASQETNLVRAAHARTFVDLVETGEAALNGPDQNAWIARMENDYNNIRSALSWAINHRCTELAVRMCSALWRFWAASGRIREGQAFMSRAIGLPDDIPTDVRVKALRRLGNICVELAEYSIAHIHFASSLSLAQESGDSVAFAQALSSLGYVALNRGDYQAADQFLQQALVCWSDSSHELDRSITLQSLGQSALGRGDFATARQMFEASFRLREQLRDKLGLAFIRYWLGQLERIEGRIDRAKQLIDDALAAFLEAGEQIGAGCAYFELGMLARSGSNQAHFFDLMYRSLESRTALGDLQGMLDSYEGIALGCCDLGRYEVGIQMLGAVQTQRDALGIAVPQATRALRDECITNADRTIGERAFSEYWDAGAAMSRRQLRSMALECSAVSTIAAGDS